jgi:hypothetical protein
MTSSKSILTIYPDSKKSLSTINPDIKEKSMTFQDEQMIPIYKKTFLTTFPDSHKNLSIERDNDIIMCGRCDKYPSIFKIYKKSDPLPNRWLNYYYDKDDYIMCYHRVWKAVRYECRFCAERIKNPNLILKLLV